MSDENWIALFNGPKRIKLYAMKGTTCYERKGGLSGFDNWYTTFGGQGLIEPFLSFDHKTTVIKAGHNDLYCPTLTVPHAPLTRDMITRRKYVDNRAEMYFVADLGQTKPADYMQGDHTLIAGYLEQNPDFDGVLCITDMYTRWVHISAGEIVSFRTYMTGAMHQSLSASEIYVTAGRDDWDEAAFLTAVDDAQSKPEILLSDMFTTQARCWMQDVSPSVLHARLIGVLIGAELKATKPYWLGQNVVILGDEPRAQHYQTALAQNGVTATVSPMDDLHLAGLIQAYQMLD